MFFARTTNRNGSMRKTAMAETREQAARQVFDLDPKARSCSTARAHQMDNGQWHDTGSAMIWHKQYDFE